MNIQRDTHYSTSDPYPTRVPDEERFVERGEPVLWSEGSDGAPMRSRGFVRAERR